MQAKPFLSLIPMAVACLLLAGCEDSKYPLSSPQKAKPDTRLIGTWRSQDKDGETTYYHVGCADEELPAGVLRTVSVTHSADGKLQTPGQFLMFPTTIGDSTCLNVTDGKEEQIQRLKENRWNPEDVDGYFFYKYEVKGDTVLVRAVDREAKKKAIESGKVKGVVEPGEDGKIRFTDTTENLARFVASAGDSLFSKEAQRFQRVK